ncbi:DsbA family oxidoreductase [Sphingobacterium sp. Mn56C]|uniref:DsbA family oxidoreductase n=1 Tax=Sphingobacterium sp. Mn56C TaxID=3395261 RepID=UPI003BEE0A84
MEKFKIEVWSDVMCPFCYIGKRKLEKSLARLPNKDQIEVVWKSYQLNPELVTNPDITIDDYLAEHKGMPKAQAAQLSAQVGEMAKEEGLTYNMDKAVVANSFRAHVFAHLAKRYGKQDEAEEILFKSYFTDGLNIDDIAVLRQLAVTIGIDAVQLEEVLLSGELDDEVKMDMHEARQIGVRGVPFFVYIRKYAVSGAQPQELFEQTIQQALEDWSKGNTLQELKTDTDAASCGIEGCD